MGKYYLYCSRDAGKPNTLFCAVHMLEVSKYFMWNTQVQISWEADISELNGEEIKVEILDKFPITTSISHNFVS